MSRDYRYDMVVRDILYSNFKYYEMKSPAFGLYELDTSNVSYTITVGLDYSVNNPNADNRYKTNCRLFLRMMQPDQIKGKNIVLTGFTCRCEPGSIIRSHWLDKKFSRSL